MRIQALVRFILTCVAACGGCAAAVSYQVLTIPLIPGSTRGTIAGMNDQGQVVGTFYGPNGPLANFLYTPGAGVTSIERTGAPSAENFEGSVVRAINGTGQILLASGLVYSPDRPPQDLAPAVRAAYPAESNIGFVSLSDSGSVSGTATDGGEPGAYTQHVFRYTPWGSSGVITVAFTTDDRLFRQGPFVMDDAQNVVYSVGFPPGGAYVFNATGATIATGCGPRGNGWATTINNSGQIGGGWGETTAFPELCTLDPNTFRGHTTTLVDESDLGNAGFVTGLNNKGDAVGFRGGLYSGAPTLFSGGQVVDVDSLFPAGSGWVVSTADRINDAGQIAGTGTVNGAPTVFVLTPVPSTTYSSHTLCVACTGIRLSDSGFAVSREASSPFRFIVSSPRGPDIELTDAAYIQQINDAGTIAGSDTSTHAFIATPPYDQFCNLDTVLGWSGGTATGINDGNDVIGQGDSPDHGPLFADVRVTNLLNINNAGQITGSYLDAGNFLHFFLFTPGIGRSELPNQPIALSNAGHVLMLSFTGEYSVASSSGIFTLPTGYNWRALNDRDESVGDCNDLKLQVQPWTTGCAVYYSPGRGLIHLDVPGYSLTIAAVINDAGQILANAYPGGSSLQEALLLTSENGLPADLIRTQSRRVSVQPLGRVPEALAGTLNGIPLTGLRSLPRPDNQGRR